MKEYYVYGWYYKDTGEYFYIGKGKGNRIDSLKNRNPLFEELIKTYEVDKRKLSEHLDEQTASILEIKLIESYILLRHPIVNINIERPRYTTRQREGIEKAKRDGKYKGVGRKKILFNKKAIGLLYPQWKDGKIKSNEFMKALGLEKMTFYRRIAEYEKENNIN